MSKNKTITKDQILTWYMEYVLEHNKIPESVYKFSKSQNFDEQTFYNYFTSFKAIEKKIFGTFFTNTIEVLKKNEDYQIFNTRNKLLSFYYTFFENLTANRSYVSFALNKEQNHLKSLKTLSGLKGLFTNYVNELGIETLDLKHEQFEKIREKSIKETAWVQLLVTIKFWLEDDSISFEKTDIFIEKSVNTTFDILYMAPIKSVLDFGKFLFKEKFQMN